MSTDLLLAEAFGSRLALELDAYLLPPLAISSSIEHRQSKGTVYLRADTLALVVRDIAVSLKDSGFTRLILANFHGGNWILKPGIRQINRDYPEFRAILLWPDLPVAQASEIFEHPVGDVHGGEFETSLMLHLYPQHVRELPRRGDSPAKNPPQAFLDYFDATELTPRGYWGWPEAATAEKGQKAWEKMVRLALDFIDQIEAFGRDLAAAKQAESRIRQLTAADIPAAMDLKNFAGWNQIEQDWRGYLEFEPAGCFAAEAGGRVAGTATTIDYGRRFGYIGMVLVHPESRRLGLGTKLLRHAIEYLQKLGTACIKLDATPMGRKVYVPLGFLDEYEITRFEGVAPVTADMRDDGRIERFEEKQVADVTAFDAAAFGAERGAVIRSLRRRNPEFCFVANGEAGITGYLIAREGQNAVQLGPWIARDAATAGQLLQAFFAQVKQRPLFVDVPHPNAEGMRLIQRHGFTVQRGFTRMYLGENRHPGIPVQVYGTGGAEKG